MSGGEDPDQPSDFPDGKQRDPDDLSGTGSNSADDEPSKTEPRFTYSLFECQECSAIALGVQHESAQFSCHDKPMEPIEEEGIDHEDPTLDHLLLDVFDLPKLLLDICHYLFEHRIATVAEIADEFEYDQDTVSTSLQELAETGLIEHHTLDREGDGEVIVYAAKGIEETRRAELIGFLHWAGQAILVLDEANEIKEQCLHEDNEGLHHAFWDIYDQRRTR